MVYKISNAAAIAKCNAVVDLHDAGAGAGTAVIYDGSEPADVDTAITTQNVLVTFTLSDPAFGAASDQNPGAQAVAAAIAAATPSANGTASWYRSYDSDSNGITQGSVTATGGGGDLTINSTTIDTGTDVTITSWVHNEVES